MIKSVGPHIRVQQPGSSRARKALDELRRGRLVVVVDDVNPNGGGDLVFAAEFATPKTLSFVVRHTSGFICVALPAAECARLQLNPMTLQDGGRSGSAYRVTVDRVGTGTGISAIDRARTIAALGDPKSGPGDFLRPGHVVPVQARDGGILHPSAGRAEAASELARLAGVRSAAGLCEIVSTRHVTAMACGSELHDFAAENNLVLVTLDDILQYRLCAEALVEAETSSVIQTRYGSFRAIGYRVVAEQGEHIAFVAVGTDLSREVPVHVHRACVAGDVFAAFTCECGNDLADALVHFAKVEQGVIIYQSSKNPWTCAESTATDSQRSAHIAAAVLQDLGIRRALLQSAGDLQASALRAHGISIAQLGDSTSQRRTIA